MPALVSSARSRRSTLSTPGIYLKYRRVKNTSHLTENVLYLYMEMLLILENFYRNYVVFAVTKICSHADIRLG